MKKIFLFLTAFLFFSFGISFASTWCQWADPLPEDCRAANVLASGAEVLVLANGARIGGDDSNKWDAGYYKLQSSSPPLQENQVYSGWNYSFVDNVISKTRQIVPNYSDMTLTEFKWQKYWQLMNAYVLPAREQDCTYSGFVIPQTARSLMVDAISTGKTMTYEVYNEATGMPSGFQRTAVQSQAVLDYCLDAVLSVNTIMYIDDGSGTGKAAQIMACADAACVNAIAW